ncbi:unnamed protein product [Rotaria sp. Silwood2]|nr:unnamed protein product [Rotaria sp. Silwood2]
MASTRIISRLIVPNTLCRLSAVGNMGGPIRHLFYRNPRNLPDVFLGTTSSVFRDLEREFERMQRQFDNYFRGNSLNDNQSLVNFSRSDTNENNMIVTESDGSRKFHLGFNMHAIMLTSLANNQWLIVDNQQNQLLFINENNKIEKTQNKDSSPLNASRLANDYLVIKCENPNKLQIFKLD